jgi:molybdopterin molybdotransferase
MPEFLDLLPPDIALTRFLDHFQLQQETEIIEISQALGRVTYSDILAPHSLPTFPRSTVDGYAVIAGDTHGASSSLPVYLDLIGEVRMGDSAEFSLKDAQCALIHTGGMVPQGADAVVMLEDTQISRPGEIEILHAVAMGENVIAVGEDIKMGEIVLPKGSLLRAPEIGGLLALGITNLEAVNQPRIAIISSGDEVVPPTLDIEPGQVRDINSYTLTALIERVGAIPLRYGIIPDDEASLRKVAAKALEECDMVVITAGSSASSRDITAQVINSLGEPGVISHGVNVRPGKPTILGACKVGSASLLKPVVGLPGNPVSALVIAILFVEPVIDYLHGLSTTRIRSRINAKLSINLASKAGREDWVPVRLIPDGDGYTAEPIFGKSNLIFMLIRADGLLRVPPQATGLNAGDFAEVMLLN